MNRDKCFDCDNFFVCEKQCEEKTVNYPDLLKPVVNFLHEVRKKYPEAKVDRNGEISYCNGNDGTAFDWNINGRLCELGWGVPDGSVWAFKCFVYQDGTAECYCYPNGEARPVEVVSKKLYSVEKAEQLCKLMLRTFDYNRLFDVTLESVLGKEA